MKCLKNGMALLVLFGLYYLVPLEMRALWQPDETRYAEISREMLVSGNWIVPHFLDIRYFEKPVAGYWINNISQWLFGHNNFAVRFGSVFAIALSAFLVGGLAYRFWQDKRIAVMAGVIFLTFFLVYGVGTYAVLDPMVTLWLVAAMCLFWLGISAKTTTQKTLMYLLLGLACGMGVMTKGFLALVVPVVSVLPWVIYQKRWKDVLIYGPLSVLSAFLVTLPWALSIAHQEADFWRYFFWVEHIQRFAEDNAQHKAPFWYYLPVFLAAALPWLGLVFGALSRAWRERSVSAEGLYLFFWFLMPFLFFSIAKGKLVTYILPCFAPLAILVARRAVLLASTGSRELKINAWINTLVGGVCALIVLFVLAPWSPVQDPLYEKHEVFSVALGTIAFLFWSLIGIFSLSNVSSRWYFSALCPLGVALVIGSVMPEKVVNSKQPQPFITKIKQDLNGSRYVLTNSVGVAAGLAWELQRSDIQLYAQKGELEYGLSYPDSRTRFVAADHFSDWLEKHRREGAISLVLHLPSKGRISCDGSASGEKIPKADRVYQQGRFLLCHYDKH